MALATQTKISAVNSRAAASLSAGSTWTGGFEPCEEFVKVIVTVTASSTQKVGFLYFDFSNDKVDAASYRLFVGDAELNKTLSCAIPTCKYIRMRFQAIAITDSRATPVANDFADLVLRTMLRGVRGTSDIEVSRQRVTLSGYDTFVGQSDPVTRLLGDNGPDLSNFPMLASNQNVFVRNVSGTQNDVAGTAARTFMVRGIDADNNEVVWVADFVASNADTHGNGNGYSVASGSIFTRINDFCILTFGSDGVPASGSTLTAEIYDPGPAAKVPVITLSSTNKFQRDTACFSVPAGFVCVARRLQSTAALGSTGSVSLARVKSSTRVADNIVTAFGDKVDIELVDDSCIALPGDMVVAQAYGKSGNNVSLFADLLLRGMLPPPGVLTTATNMNASETYNENGTRALTAIVISSAASTASATLTMSSGNGTLSTHTSGAVTSTYSSGVWSASGALADVNACLANITYTPTTDFSSSFSMTTSVTANATTITGSKAFTATTTLSATNLSASETYDQDVDLAITAIVITTSSTTASATLTMSSGNGSLSTPTSGAVTATYSAGVWNASGAVADVNTCLANITYTPTSGFSSNFSMTTSVTAANGRTVTGSKSFTGVPTTTNPVSGSIFHVSAKNLLGDNSVISDGAAVSSWVDLSSSGWNFSQTTSHKPTFRTNQFGSHPAVVFNTDGSTANILEVHDSHTMPGAFTIVVVYKLFAGGDSMFVLGPETNIGGQSQILRFVLGSNTIMSYNGSVVSAPYTDAQQPSIVILRGDTNSTFTGDFRVNGSGLGTSGTFTSTSFHFGTIGSLGGYINNAQENSNIPQGLLVGMIGEIFIYDRRLTNDECVQMESYFTSNWS